MSIESLKFKNNLGITQGLSPTKTLNFEYSSCSTACRLTFVLVMQHGLFCSALVLLYDEEGHKPALEYIPVLF